jgi:hypothetical protein
MIFKKNDQIKNSLIYAKAINVLIIILNDIL